jgi:hypothetical protein
MTYRMTISRFQPAGLVQPDTPELRYADTFGEHDMRGIALPTLESGRLGSAETAQQRVRPGVQDRRPPELRARQLAVVEHDDPASDGLPAPGVDLVAGSSPRNPEVAKLSPGDHAGLAFG